jgi:hypothetical protein
MIPAHFNSPPRASIDADRLETLKQLKSFRLLSESMLAYQRGDGPPPSVADFTSWRFEVANSADARRIRQAASLI